MIHSQRIIFFLFALMWVRSYVHMATGRKSCSATWGVETKRYVGRGDRTLHGAWRQDATWGVETGRYMGRGDRTIHGAWRQDDTWGVETRRYVGRGDKTLRGAWYR